MPEPIEFTADQARTLRALLSPVLGPRRPLDPGVLRYEFSQYFDRADHELQQPRSPDPISLHNPGEFAAFVQRMLWALREDDEPAMPPQPFGEAQFASMWCTTWSFELGADTGIRSHLWAKAASGLPADPANLDPSRARDVAALACLPRHTFDDAEGALRSAQEWAAAASSPPLVKTLNDDDLYSGCYPIALEDLFALLGMETTGTFAGLDPLVRIALWQDEYDVDYTFALSDGARGMVAAARALVPLDD